MVEVGCLCLQHCVGQGTIAAVEQTATISMNALKETNVLKEVQIPYLVKQDIINTKGPNQTVKSAQQGSIAMTLMAQSSYMGSISALKVIIVQMAQDMQNSLSVLLVHSTTGLAWMKS